jgi:hypothetical protein
MRGGLLKDPEDDSPRASDAKASAALGDKLKTNQVLQGQRIKRARTSAYRMWAGLPITIIDTNSIRVVEGSAPPLKLGAAIWVNSFAWRAGFVSP